MNDLCFTGWDEWVAGVWETLVWRIEHKSQPAMTMNAVAISITIDRLQK